MQPAPLPCAPVRYRVQATLAAGCEPSGPVVVYTGPECRCRYRFPPGCAEARFAVVAMRGLAESGPSAPVTCTRPAVLFSYDHDMDERGLFHYIGTQGRTQPFCNPAKAGLVTATRSSDWNGTASDALGRQPCDSSTSSQPMPPWWQVDLGAGRLFTPTRYTLRHTNHPPNVEFRLQSWRLEGSANDADGSWRTLDEHTNEPNAIPARADAMTTFAVAPERAFPARRFRVLMTGPSPNGNYYLMLSGLEMYGSLLHDPTQHPPESRLESGAPYRPPTNRPPNSAAAVHAPTGPRTCPLAPALPQRYNRWTCWRRGYVLEASSSEP
ncbi:hypothetical protein PAPYR_4474 [Paratrimastix pyriformis]|uniref:F5/8 type C domain-containing protein n=1 Tax=Paratrimastix pyriformis TaxID=342808 RepID=A0ABQ8UJL9_9EUKA|nr:hypothetical protein PAPYR_4474 [Paratrimastix pyriformis]